MGEDVGIRGSEVETAAQVSVAIFVELCGTFQSYEGFYVHFGKGLIIIIILFGELSTLFWKS